MAVPTAQPGRRRHAGEGRADEIVAGSRRDGAPDHDRMETRCRGVATASACPDVVQRTPQVGQIGAALGIEGVPTQSKDTSARSRATQDQWSR